MSVWDIVFIGVGLSMDAAAVSISNGLTYRCLSRGQKLSMPVAFGFFQGLMPLLGFFAGSLFAGIIGKYSGITTLVILVAIGGKMIYDAFQPCDAGEGCCAVFSGRILLMQALATSIDAFAVGVSFCAGGVNIFVASPVIACVTFLCSLLALLVGRAVGPMLGPRAQMLGGMILIFIGFKAMM